ncbi:MAG: triose-phosphate isomerase [Candidatus Woesearchaeota archaeon]
MKFPVLIINFKTYSQATGKNAEYLAEICSQLAKESRKNIMISVQPTDIFRITSKYSIPVLAQHIDPFEQGRNTGKILGEALKSAGAFGVLINHSEDPCRLDIIEEAVKKAKKLNLKTIVCAGDAKTAEAVAVFEPDAIAVEPPELVSGKTSVSEAKPEVIKKAVSAVHKVKNIPVLCGAGVHNLQDVKKAIELGAKGILIANAVCTSQDPGSVIKELLKGLEHF